MITMNHKQLPFNRMKPFYFEGCCFNTHFCLTAVVAISPLPISLRLGKGGRETRQTQYWALIYNTMLLLWHFTVLLFLFPPFTTSGVGPNFLTHTQVSEHGPAQHVQVQSQSERETWTCKNRRGEASCLLIDKLAKGGKNPSCVTRKVL